MKPHLTTLMVALTLLVACGGPRDAQTGSTALAVNTSGSRRGQPRK